MASDEIFSMVDDVVFCVKGGALRAAFVRAGEATSLDIVYIVAPCIMLSSTLLTN